MTGAARAIVVGSGPSGSAAARVLMDAGIRPIVIDGGVRGSTGALQKKEDARRGGVSASGPSAYVRTNPGQKAWFGSSAPFEQSAQSVIEYDHSIVARASFSRGGYSRVWGATNAFFSSFSGWERSMVPTDADRAVVRGIVPESVTTWGAPASELADGQVAGSLRSRVAMSALTAAGGPGWRIEPSRVAIESRASAHNRCRTDGRCLTGCPFDSIWYSADLVEQWGRDGLLDYRPGLLARRAWESDGLAHVEVVDQRGGVSVLSAESVYLAMGAISTAALVIQSDRYDSVTIPDTATAFGGAIALRPQGPAGPAHHGLSQWWVRPSGDDEFLAQVYPPTREHAARLQAMIPGGRALAWPAEVAAGRLHPIISYLTSDKSDPFTVSRSGAGVSVSGTTSRDTRRAFSAHLRSLGRSLLKAGYLMPLAATEFSAPGTGYHFGASLPHGRRTDGLGRLSGWARIHIVDSSVLPALEVGSITPTVMANAARIARESLKEAP